MMARILAVSFCPVPTLEVQQEITIASTSVAQTGEPSIEKLLKDLGEEPKFGSWLKFDSPSFYF